LSSALPLFPHLLLAAQPHVALHLLLNAAALHFSRIVGRRLAILSEWRYRTAVPIAAGWWSFRLIVRVRRFGNIDVG
jgi:hypothetical protein